MEDKLGYFRFVATFLLLGGFLIFTVPPASAQASDIEIKVQASLIINSPNNYYPFKNTKIVLGVIEDDTPDNLGDYGANYGTCVTDDAGRCSIQLQFPHPGTVLDLQDFSVNNILDYQEGSKNCVLAVKNPHLNGPHTKLGGGVYYTLNIFYKCFLG